MNSDGENWIKECASEVYILGGEEIYAIRDSTNRFGFEHMSREKCYECSISNSINSGSDGHTFEKLQHWNNLCYTTSDCKLYPRNKVDMSRIKFDIMT